MIKTSGKNIKINIIPLIDIIFLMLVFFMLATNFSEKKEISFSIPKEINEFNDSQENLIIKIISDDYFIFKTKISSENIEKKILNLWENKEYKNIIILNDNKSRIQGLINLLDILKKNNIETVSFADDPQQ